MRDAVCVRIFCAPSYPYPSYDLCFCSPALTWQASTRRTRTSEQINTTIGMRDQSSTTESNACPPLRTAPTTLPHFYHRGLLLLSPSCYCLSVALASEFGRIVVLPHPDGLDEINSDRADARGLTVSGGGMLLRRGSNSAPTPLSYYPHSAPLSEPNRRKPPWQIWEISQSCSEFSDFYCIAA